MDTEKQRQHRRDNMRLIECGNARSEQLLVVPTESLTNREWLPGELLNGLECQRPGWFLDMKYQTCFRNFSIKFIGRKTALSHEYHNIYSYDFYQHAAKDL